MADEQTSSKEEATSEGTKCPGWMAQMMSACGPGMQERMEKCLANMQAFDDCCRSQPEKETPQPEGARAD